MTTRAGGPADPDPEGGALTPYERLLGRLFTTNLFRATSDGLRTMDRLHRAAGSPMERRGAPRVVHVAGSNGKGSVALKIARTLRASGYRVGLFGSPHVSSFRERIQIDEVPASEERVTTGLARLFALCDARAIPATFFEVVTALAFVVFAEAGVDVVVLETGLGGRLDATNVIRRPLLAIITSIGLEHTQILGDTVEQIAREKGGIIKEGCPVLVGRAVPVDVLRECAAEKQASHLYECADLLAADALPELDHDYDAENSRTATAALTLLRRILRTEHAARTNSVPDISPQQIAEGVRARPMCRFEELVVAAPAAAEAGGAPAQVVLDVAHNPPALAGLVAKLRARHLGAPLRVVAGLSADKDLARCSDLLLEAVPHPRHLHLVEASHPRAASVAALLEANPRLRACRRRDPSIARQVRGALELAAARGEVLVVCGSFFVMADARRELGIEEPRDGAAIGAEVVRIIASRRNGVENGGE